MSGLNPRDVRTADDARRVVEARNLSHVKIGFLDLDGVMVGKYMHRDKFFAALDGGFAFCDVVLGWDSKDELYDNTRYTGWHTGYPDAQLRVLPESCREVPFEGDMLLFMAEFTERAEAICPRGLLRRVLGRAADAQEAPVILDEYANTSSAGSVIAFHQYSADLAAGDIGVLCSFGAGYSIGSAILRRA